MKAVIMAGGFGTRIRPLTSSIPKPMLPLVNVPLMEHVINLLKAHSINELVVLLFFQPEVIKEYFGDGSNFGVRIKYILPDRDYGTAGAVGFCRDLIKDTFLVISADLLTDFDLISLINFHKKKGAVATLGLVSVVNPLQFGVVITDKDGKVVRFLEKPGWGEVFSDTVNTGIYVLEPEVFEYIPEMTEFDFSKDLFPLLLSQGKALYGYKYQGYWRDVGDPESYREAHYDVFDGAIKVYIPGEKLDYIGRDVRAEENVKIADGVRFERTVVIGRGTSIAEKAFVKNSSIGRNCRIMEGAVVEDSILWDNVIIDKNARVVGAIICSNCEVGEGAYIGKGSVIAEKCKIGKGAYVKEGVKVWPGKIIEDEAVLTDNLIWGEKWRKRIFESAKVIGLTNKELTPEFVVKLGVAYGSHLKKGSFILTGRDSIAASRMLKRAFIGGVLSTGVGVKDLKLVPDPVLRYKLQSFGEVGGVYFRQSSDDPEVTEIYFYDSHGLEMSSSQEKGIERIFSREDFRRVDVYEQGVLEEPQKILEFYVEGYLKALDVEAIKKRKFKIVIDFFHGPSALVLPEVLQEMRCEVVAVNANLEKVPHTLDKRKSLEDLCKMVSVLEADCGFWISDDCRKVVLVSERGDVLVEERLLSVISYLYTCSEKAGVFVFPVTIPLYVEEFLKSRGFEVKRVPSGRRRILEEVLNTRNAIFAVNREFEFVFPPFHTAFDGMFAVGKVLELLAHSNLSLSEAISKAPSGVFIKREIQCPWEVKGYIMRKLVEHFVDKEVSLFDGVRVYFNEATVLALPDQERPLFHIYAEGKRFSDAKMLIDELVSLIKKWREEE